LAGCGGGGHQPKKNKGELLLAEVEYAQASFREAPEQLSGDLPKVAGEVVEELDQEVKSE
jgi:hypothetical protein